MYIRKLSLEDENNDSVFLWGARQVGKTTLLEQIYPQARYYDLLQAKEFERFLRKPSLLSEESAAWDMHQNLHPLVSICN